MADNAKKKMWRRVLLIAVACGVIALLVLAMMPKPLGVESAKVVRKDLSVRVQDDGVTRVKDRFIVSSPLSGVISRVQLKAGDKIEKGDIIARIMPMAHPLKDEQSKAQSLARLAASLASEKQSKAMISRAKAALNLAESEFKRALPLSKSGAISSREADRARFEERSSRDELASAEFGAKVASHEVRMARAALGRFGAAVGEQLEIPSPASGVVLRVLRQSEGVVQPGEPVLEIGDPAHLEATIDVLTTDAIRIERHARVDIRPSARSEAIPAHVRRVEPAAFKKLSSLGVEEQRVNVVVDLDGDAKQWEKLGDGFRILADIEVAHRENVLTLPSGSLFRHGGEWAVFLIDAQNEAKRVAVKIGERSATDVEILDGVAEGARVIVYPSDDVEVGREVE